MHDPVVPFEEVVAQMQGYPSDNDVLFGITRDGPGWQHNGWEKDHRDGGQSAGGS